MGYVFDFPVSSLEAAKRVAEECGGELGDIALALLELYTHAAETGHSILSRKEADRRFGSAVVDGLLVQGALVSRGECAVSLPEPVALYEPDCDDDPAGGKS